MTEVKAQVLTIKLELAKMTIDLIRNRYAALLNRQKSELKKASAAAADRANQTSDPLEKYRAHRKQELLDQQELLREKEQEKAASPLISFDEQKTKANKAEQDFEKLKKLVEGGRSSTLVAQRLNNSYRRLSTERASISRDELLKITALLGKYENELTAIELDLLNDERGDGSLRENLLASLPKGREPEALAVFSETEQALRHVLEERRKILTSLEERAEKTREEVLRRLRILEDQHAFVRTHLFWVRDSQPIGTNSIVRIRREGRDLGGTLLSIAAEPWKRSHWERISGEFLLVVVGLLVLPYGLYRARKALRSILAREPEPQMAHAS